MVGVVVFILVLLILVLVHEWGHFAAARLFGVGVEEFGFGFPPAIARRQWGNTTYSFNWLPLGGFVRIKGEERVVNEADSFSAQRPSRRAAIILAGVAMNVLLTILLLTIGFNLGLPQDLSQEAPDGAIVSQVRHHVVEVLPGSPAAGRLEANDAIVTIDGQAFATLVELQRYIRSHGQQQLLLSVERGDRTMIAAITPTLLTAGGEERYGIGVGLFTTGEVSYPWYRTPFEAIRLTGDLFVRIVQTMWQAATDLWYGRGASVDVAGPVGIAVITSQVTKLGFVYLVQFVALLSLNLAFINLLPFPALDGGRLLFIVLEVLRGKAVDENLEARMHRWGFTVLLLVVLFVTYLDVHRLSSLFREWFGRAG